MKLLAGVKLSITFHVGAAINPGKALERGRRRAAQRASLGI